MSGPLPSMRCVCGHWDTEHAAFSRNIRPGQTRTFCDRCGCRSWATPEDSRVARALADRELADRDDRIDADLGTGYIGEFR